MKAGLFAVFVALLLAAHCVSSSEEPALWPIQQNLAGKEFVDLTHEFGPGIPHWPGFPDKTRKTIYWYEKRPDTKGVVVDLHEEAAKNPDSTLTLERLKKREADHGQIPSGAFVAMRTDWSKRWPDAAKMSNKDAQGIAH